MSVIPPFDQRGLLPPGDYVVTFAETRASHLVTGAGESGTWDPLWRAQLVDKCEILVRQLWQVGVTEIVLDGSFVEQKDRPGDIDGYFSCDVTRIEAVVNALNALDPYRIWTWDHRTRRPDPSSGKLQLPMWHQYRNELYPHVGQSSGIPDQFGHHLLFPSAFRQQRGTFKPKGVLKIVPGGQDDQN